VATDLIGGKRRTSLKQTVSPMAGAKAKARTLPKVFSTDCDTTEQWERFGRLVEDTARTDAAELTLGSVFASGSQLSDSGQFFFNELIGQPRVAQICGKSLSICQHPLQEIFERSALGGV